MEQVRLILNPAEWIGPIERACDYDVDGITPLEVIERCKSQDALAFEIEGQLLLVVEILERDSRVLNVALICGHGWVEYRSTVLAFLDRLAADQRCDRIRVQGRRGWARELKQDGYDHKAVILEKVLT